nr:glycosyltransferase family 2 protein [Armatimonas sp.]
MYTCSILIVTYRCKDDALRCLASLSPAFPVIGREGPGEGGPFQIIVADNASGDGTVEAIRAQFPLVCVLGLDENIGFARANNLAAKHATGEFLLLLNPDTVIPELGTLERCVAYLAAQDSYTCGMTCRVESEDGSLQWECARHFPTVSSECAKAFFPYKRWDAIKSFDVTKEQAVPCVLGAFVLLRRANWEALAGFDERFFLMYEDVDLCRRLYEQGWKLMYWPEARIIHTGGQSWKSEKPRTYANTHLSSLQYIQKYWPGSERGVKFMFRVALALKKLATRGNPEKQAMILAAQEALR